MKQREKCDNAAKKAYQKCGGRHTKCTTGRGQYATWYKASVLKSIIPMITPVDESIDKVGILDKHLGDDDNKEYKVCCFINERIKAKEKALAEEEERKRKIEEKENLSPERRSLQLAGQDPSDINFYLLHGLLDDDNNVEDDDKNDKEEEEEPSKTKQKGHKKSSPTI